MSAASSRRKIISGMQKSMVSTNSAMPRGVCFGAGDTYNFNSDWYGSLTVGSSAGGFFWPRFRADGFINKKWRGRRQLITTLGFGYYAAKDAHRDHSFFVGSTYYFKKPWILEEGVRFNVSNPGSVFSPAGFIAVTQGRSQQTLHHHSGWPWKRGLSTNRSNLDHYGFSQPDLDDYMAPVGGSTLGRRCRCRLSVTTRPILEVVRALDSSGIFEENSQQQGDPSPRRGQTRFASADIAAGSFPCTGRWSIFAWAP